MVDGVREGSKVLLTFRPDDVVVLGDSTRPDGLNIMEAVVESVQVTKCSIKLVLGFPRGGAIKAEVGRGCLIKLANELRAGVNVRIGVPVEYVRVCPQREI